MENRQPSIDCVIDEWTKPAIWEDIVLSEHINFYLVDFNGEKLPDIPSNKKVVTHNKVAKLQKKQLWRSVFLSIRHSILNADSTKTHSSRVTF